MSGDAGAGGGGSLTILVHMADQRRDRTDSHGIINFSVGLVRALPAVLGPQERLVITATGPIRDELTAGGALREVDVVELVPAGGTGRRLWSDHVDVGRRVAAAGADVVLFPKGFLPLRRTGAIQIACLHDDIPVLAREHAPDLRRRLRADYFTRMIRHSMRTADVRLYVSRFTEGRLRSLVDVAGADDAVIHEGITVPLRDPLPLAARERRALLFGSGHPHKRTAAGLRLASGSTALAEHVDEIAVLGACPEVVGTGALPIREIEGPRTNDEVAALLAESRALLFPSEYEGYGLPPVEALASGTPCVYRRTGASDEVLDDVPGGYGAESQEDFDRAVGEALSLDDHALGRLADRMRADHDWTVVAERVAAAARRSVRRRRSTFR